MSPLVANGLDQKDLPLSAPALLFIIKDQRLKNQCMSTSSVIVSQSMIFTIAAAPPSSQQAALHKPVLEKAEADTAMVVADVLAIALTVSRASFLISGLLVPCSLFLGGPSLLITRAIVMFALEPYYSAVMLATLLPFASRKDILTSMIIAVCSLMSPLVAFSVESIAIIFASDATDPKCHHYLIPATALGLCAATDHELNMLLLLSYCALNAAILFRRFLIK